MLLPFKLGAAADRERRQGFSWIGLDDALYAMYTSSGTTHTAGQLVAPSRCRRRICPCARSRAAASAVVPLPRVVRACSELGEEMLSRVNRRASGSARSGSRERRRLEDALTDRPG